MKSGDIALTLQLDLDQIFVQIGTLISGLFPVPAQKWVMALLAIGCIMPGFAIFFGLTTVAERKLLGRVQNRFGPNRVGPWGFFQFMADGVKMLTKEDIVPFSADQTLHFLAPLALTVPVWLAFAVLPFGRNMAAVDLDAGILFFFAIGSASELAVFMAGWSSQNKYSLVGAMRAIAQMISYEVPLVLSTVPVLMLAGSLSLVEIVRAQGTETYGGLERWNAFTPWGLAGLVLFLIAACAESNRSPFDLPEGESEIIAGFLTEYSGFKYALFFLGEYLGLFAMTGLAVTLFLGGWHAPFRWLEWVPSWLWFGGKFVAIIFLFIWVRATLPRLRLDQLLNFSWRFMVPLCLINLLAAAAWFWTSAWASIAAAPVRWVLCAALIALPYHWLARALRGNLPPPRKYTYAE